MRRSARRGRAWGPRWSLSVSSQFENRHLARRSELFTRGADGNEIDRVAMLLRDGGCPSLKLCTSPLEAVIAVAESASGQGFEKHIVLGVRGRDGDATWPGVSEKD